MTDKDEVNEIVYQFQVSISSCIRICINVNIILGTEAFGIISQFFASLLSRNAFVSAVTCNL